MQQLTCDLFLSLDGFAAGKDVGPFFGFAGPQLNAWVESHLETDQIILMGRKTYVAMADIAARYPEGPNKRLTALQKVVVSNTLKGVSWENTRLGSGDAAKVVRELKQNSIHPIRTIGSLSLVRSLAAAGEVDWLRLGIFPILLGEDGMECFFPGLRRSAAELARSEVLDGRIAILTYRLGN